ncbi:MAG: nucleotidyltransferase domain-containing protein [Phycisphaerales bacterium]|nr:nucleotidyltransferase domain-containing protein [Phycisphaerales bacterium]
MHTSTGTEPGEPLTRSDVIAHLAAHFEPDPRILAAWLGGSDATGRADELSDVDVCLVVEDGALEHAAASFDRAAENLGLRVRFRMPWPTWHGFHQAFYQLSRAPEHLMIDWVILERSQPHPWFEIERHGTPRVLFDKAGLIRPARVDREALARTLAAKAPDLRRRFLIFRHLPAKLAVRHKRGLSGLPLDAVHFYHSMVIRLLVDMLRIVHAPLRHDFGMRYLDEDLPRDLYDALVELSYPASHAQIPEFVQRASALFDEAWARWESGAAVLRPGED